jgi:hypothetical protein
MTHQLVEKAWTLFILRSPHSQSPVTTATKIPDVERLTLPDVLPLAEFGRQSACRPDLSAVKGLIPVMEG